MIKQNKQGQLIIISAPSGAGKGTIIRELLNVNKNLYLSISATTRAPRVGEVPNQSYYFYEKNKFLDLIEEDYFLEYASYLDNYYGTPKDVIQMKLDEGKDVILEIEIKGAMQVKERVPEALLIFVMPPTIEELRSRLVNRNTESKEDILRRFKESYKEINTFTKYNYVVVNDIVSEAVDKINSIIKAEKCRVDRIEELSLGSEEEYIHELLLDEKDFINESIIL